MIEDLFEEALLSTPARVDIVSDKGPSLGECILFLAGRCDGAYRIDGAGFNKLDARRGHRLADTPPDQWSPWDRYWSWHILRRYRRQLEEGGYKWQLVAKPPRPEHKEPIREVVLMFDGDFGVRYAHLPTVEFEAVRAGVGNIPGRTWIYDKETGIMARIPADIQSVRALRDWAGMAGFEWDERCERAMIEAMGRSELMLELSRATDWPDYLLGPAELTSTAGKQAWGSQRAGIKYIEMAGWRVIVGDQMGTGKTDLGILAAIKARVEKLLVICPLGVREQWVQFIRDWMPDKRIVEIVSGKPKKLGRADVVVVSYSTLRYDIHRNDEGEEIDRTPNGALTSLMLTEFDGVIVDEAHFLMHRDTQRTHAVRGIVHSSDPFFRLFMSGTIILNRENELISNLELSGGLKHFGNIANLRRNYFGARENLLALNQKLRETTFLCRLKDHHAWSPDGVLKHIRDVPLEVAPEEMRLRYDDDELDRRTIGALEASLKRFDWTLVPGTLRLKSKIYQSHEFTLSGQEAEMYWDAHIRTKEYLRELAMEAGEPESFERWMKALALVRINKLRQLIVELKFPMVRQWTHEFLESGEKLVMGVFHEAIARKFEAAFPGSVTIRGGVSRAQRREAKELFMRDPETKLMILNMESGGVALDGLQQNCSRIAATEFLWSNGKMEQFFDRVHRGGQRSQVICDWLVAAIPPDSMGLPRKTIDQYFLKVIADKAGTSAAMLHGMDVPPDDATDAVINAFLEEAA